MIFSLFLALLFFSDNAFAEQLPKWATQTPQRDKSYQYFLGTGNGKTKDKARDSAVGDARDQACLSLVSDVRVETTVVATYEDSDMDDRTKVFCSARLKKFERAEKPFCQKSEKNEYSCYVLYRYPLEERRKEEKRLEESETISPEMNVVGNDPRNGTLIVDTGNVIADLYIDGEKAGKTPIKLVGVVEPEKKHTLKIDAAAYEVYEKEFVVHKNIEEPVSPVLFPAYAQIKFEFAPDTDDAVLKMNGREIKPGKRQKVPAGKKIKIEASHPRYKPFSAEYSFKRGEKRTVPLHLLENEADLYLIVSRPEYRVDVDGEVSPSRDKELHFRLSPGKHKITVYAGKSKTVSDTVTLKPADKKTFEINEDFLNSKKEEKKNILPAVFIPHKGEEPFVGKFDLSRMLKNIDFSYLVPRLSYDTLSGSVRFTVTVGIDPKKYRENFVEPLKKALLKSSYSAAGIKEENLSLRCVNANDQPQPSCGVEPVSGQTAAYTTAYVRTGEPVSNLLGRKAPFASIADIPDWAAGYDDVPVRKLEVFFALFDKNKKNLFARSVPFTLVPFQIVGNMYVFSPIMTATTFCRKTEMFGDAQDFVCGATVFQARTEKVRIDLNNVSEIYISVGATK